MTIVIFRADTEWGFVSRIFIPEHQRFETAMYLADEDAYIVNGEYMAAEA